jgi:hypothetical protein
MARPSRELGPVDLILFGNLERAAATMAARKAQCDAPSKAATALCRLAHIGHRDQAGNVPPHGRQRIFEMFADAPRLVI